MHKLPPGHYLAWRDGRLEVRQYWQIGNAERFRGTSEEAARMCFSRLAHKMPVRVRMIKRQAGA